eukprot:7860411-Ditylum_brightwellii.AAC.1
MVQFPVRSSEILHGKEQGLGEEMITIDLSHGGSFINDSEKIKNRDVPDILSLFAEFVSYRGLQHTPYHHMIYEAVPSMMVNLANGSRINSGFRFVHRCSCHAVDSKSHDLSK